MQSNATIPARGFTLIELLVVLVILGLIAGLTVPNLIGRTEQAKSQAAEAEIERLKMGIEAFYLDTGGLPRRLASLTEEPPGVEAWNGPYVQASALTDPWGNDYRYRNPGEHGRFDVFSLGADDAPGGEDTARDIVSWE